MWIEQPCKMGCVNQRCPSLCSICVPNPNPDPCYVKKCMNIWGVPKKILYPRYPCFNEDASFMYWGLKTFNRNLFKFHRP